MKIKCKELFSILYNGQLSTDARQKHFTRNVIKTHQELNPVEWTIVCRLDRPKTKQKRIVIKGREDLKNETKRYWDHQELLRKRYNKMLEEIMALAKKRDYSEDIEILEELFK